MNILAVIPARGGSKGVPEKNKKKLNGKPLISYTIESAIQSKLISRIAVTSDDQDILHISAKYSLDYVINRPSELANDSVSTISVIEHALEFCEDPQSRFSAIILLQPTSPFRPDGFIDLCIERFIKMHCDTLISVQPIPVKYNPYWAFEEDDTGLLKRAITERTIISRRQDLPAAYHRDGSVYIISTKTIRDGTLYGPRIGYYKSDDLYGINIDNYEDWELAEKFIWDKENIK
jgi:CMP-N,N'-diacetyllegionaminic acid synthase